MGRLVDHTGLSASVCEDMASCKSWKTGVRQSNGQLGRVCFNLGKRAIKPGSDRKNEFGVCQKQQGSQQQPGREMLPEREWLSVSELTGGVR